MAVFARLRVIDLVVGFVADTPQPVVLLADIIQFRDGKDHLKRSRFPTVRFKTEIEGIKVVVRNTPRRKCNERLVGPIIQIEFS